jgi:hypothetical protein
MFVAFENGRKQAYHRFTGDRAAAIKPGAISLYDEWQIAAVSDGARLSRFFANRGAPFFHNIAFPYV